MEKKPIRRIFALPGPDQTPSPPSRSSIFPSHLPSESRPSTTQPWLIRTPATSHLGLGSSRLLSSPPQRENASDPLPLVVDSYLLHPPLRRRTDRPPQSVSAMMADPSFAGDPPRAPAAPPSTQALSSDGFNSTCNLRTIILHLERPQQTPKSQLHGVSYFQDQISATPASLSSRPPAIYIARRDSPRPMIPPPHLEQRRSRFSHDLADGTL